MDLRKKPGRKNVAFAIAVGAAALIGGLVFWARPGDIVASIDVRHGPRVSAPLELARGDTIAVTFDYDVSFAWSAGRVNARPQGCQLDLGLLDASGKEAARASCGLGNGTFRTVGGSVETSESGPGTIRQKHRDFWTSCRIVVPTAGRHTLRAKTNLSTCVRELHTATLHFHRR
jgi:hypothetical protein